MVSKTHIEMRNVHPLIVLLGIHFDMNPNTNAPVGHADTFKVATNRVWCCAAYPSRVTLPVEPP